MRTGQQRWGFVAGLGGFDERLLKELVQGSGQPLGKPPRVREHDRRAVPKHLLNDGGVDVRPDRAGALQGALVALEPLGGRPRPQLGHVFNGHHDTQIEGLLDRRRHDRHRHLPAEEARDLLRGTNGRGEPDALRRRGEQRIQSLQ